MLKRLLAAIALAVTILVSCGPRPSGSVSNSGSGHIPELLCAVPSDALAVICSNNCKEALSYLDSTNILQKLNLSFLKNERISISLCYNGSVVPSLAIATGTNPSDSSARTEALLRDADRLGLYSARFEPDAHNGKSEIVIITPSESILAAVRRHISEHRSIMDAPDFEAALNATGHSENFIILRNESAGIVAPKQFLLGIFPRRSTTNFLHKLAEWTVLVPTITGDFDIMTVQGESDEFFVNMFKDLPYGNSRLGVILPSDTQFAISVMTASNNFREAYERYLDASIKLNKYRQRLISLEKDCGTDPQEWEKRLDIKEVALVRMDTSTVVLARPARPAKDKAPEENKFRGFASALYGEAFSLEDDSVLAADKGWYVFGSAEGVNEFLNRTLNENTKWPGNNCHTIIYSPNKTISWNKKGIKLWITIH